MLKSINKVKPKVKPLLYIFLEVDDAGIIYMCNAHKPNEYVEHNASGTVFFLLKKNQILLESLLYSNIANRHFSGI